jgi:alkylresorcinol/alkylpyrone synthase
MLNEVARARPARLDSAIDVEILSVATAVPEHVVTQTDIGERARRISPQFAHMESLFANTGISRRYAVEPAEWYLEPRNWVERTASYQKHALDLLARVAQDAVDAAGLRLSDIDGMVVNTITGLAVPSLDAMLMNRLDFNPAVERIPIFGLGCGGGVGGLSRATRLAQAIPNGNVLFLTVDLCSLCLRINDPGIAMFVAAALFGDGAAAVVLHNASGEAGRNPEARARILAVGDHFWRETEHIMGWSVENDGFGVVLSPELPMLMRERLGEAVEGFLRRNGIEQSEFKGYLLHPGGRKVLEAAQKVLQITPQDVGDSWDVLRDFGNMSSVTAMFILNQAIRRGAEGRHLLAAFGPGFSAYFMALDL